MGKALDGLKGVSEHTFNQESWIFYVTYNQKKLSKEKIIKSVESAEEGFKVKNWKRIHPKRGE